EISSATGEIFSQSPNSGSDLYESASYNGTAPGCGGGGYDINHGGTNGGSTCLGGVGDIGVNTANLPSWTWTVQRVPEPTTLVVPGPRLPLGRPGIGPGAGRWPPEGLRLLGSPNGPSASRSRHLLGPPRPAGGGICY